MPARYVTLQKSQPDFLNHLWGRTGSGERSIPVKTYNLGTPEESVTFEIQNLKDIKRPSFFIFLASLIKLKSFILILLPLFFILSKTYLQNTLNDPLALVLAALGMLLLFAGLNMRNDVYDHISGFDRVNLDSSPKPIRRGWITAEKASRWSLGLIVVAFLLALPVMLIHSELLKVLGVGLVLFFLGKFSKNNSYKQQHFGELVLFLLIGPALVAGYEVAVGSSLDGVGVAFGLLWGFAVLYLVQVNNFSHIMTSSQSKIKNSMTKLGFDLSQKFLFGAWMTFIVLFCAFHYFYAGVYVAAVLSVLLILGSLPLFIKVLNIKSPMGSGVQQVRRAGHQAFLVMVFLFVIEHVFYFWLARP